MASTKVIRLFEGSSFVLVATNVISYTTNFPFLQYHPNSKLTEIITFPHCEDQKPAKERTYLNVMLITQKNKDILIMFYKKKKKKKI